MLAVSCCCSARSMLFRH